ncbi:cytochrome-c peroxidase [Desulfurivibrio alkaliphilus]|uniref:Cytochrome-c peroxidase n=1 Tax=Desulfurivibrio alkaliphilus (strain DSM 19089 / UNIQEM U267 / AHT2) TaxID=589865 RepID=D6Z4S3_DESAT|nr:cytochrome c peroxidase [Desulfurivibrio alkaliphilus]ADH86548.1 Cytochrome-c peroxidase [Desulfurivibrio alkaliphilus AHT 2]
MPITPLNFFSGCRLITASAAGLLLFFGLAWLAGYGPSTSPFAVAAQADSGPVGDVAESQLITREPIQPIPRQIAYDREKAELGRRLFNETMLSLDHSISCASCHDLNGGGHDPRPASIGIHSRQGTMASPTVFNAVFNFRQFWNGRAADLREQAAGPLTDPLEMGMSEQEVERRLNEDPGYREAFSKIYGGRQVRFEQVLDALAEFQRALITPDSLFDLYLRGEAVLMPQQQQGYLEFKELGCVTCHNGVNVGGNSFQKMGVIFPRETDDERKIMDLNQVSGREEDRQVFKVPTLRNITLTAPYFHDGSAADLPEALQNMAHHNLGVELSSRQIYLLVAFLETLTGQRPTILK